MADFADGAVLVVGRNLDDDRSSAGTIALIREFVDLTAFQFAAAAHDGAFDVIGRHTDRLSGQHGSTQTRVCVGITTAPGGDHDLFDYAREHFSALRVEGSLLVL